MLRPPKFYTLTPNPALDLSGRVKKVVPNEKNYVTDDRRDPGGNGINAARIAHRLGAEAWVLGFAGGSTGDELESLLAREGLAAHFTRVRGHTRINVTVSNQATHQQTRLTFPGPRITRSEVSALLSRVARLRAPGILALGGSLPGGIDSGFFSRLGRQAMRAGLGVIVDAPAAFLNELLGAPGFTPLLVKPNQAELEEWSGRKLKGDAALAAAARAMARHSTLVCLSLAERGAILATQDRAWFARAPRVRARGTVGAGDSMVGAMATRLLHHGLTRPDHVRAALLASPREIPPALAEMLRWGLAAGAATAEVSGTSLARRSEILRLLRSGPRNAIRPL